MYIRIKKYKSRYNTRGIFKALKENLKMSGRNYQNSGLSLLGRHRGWSVPLDTIMTDILMEICEIFQIFSESIIDFKIEQCNIENKVFTKIIRIFWNLQKCLIGDTEIYGDDSDLSLKLPKYPLLNPAIASAKPSNTPIKIIEKPIVFK